MVDEHDSATPPARSVLVDAAFRVVACSEGLEGEGRSCHEVMAHRSRPCSGCPVFGLAAGRTDPVPRLQIERVAPGRFEWVTVGGPTATAEHGACLECSRVPLGERMSSALEAMCSDQRYAAIGEHVELLANKVQGLSLAIELLRQRVEDPKSLRLLEGMADNCRDLVEEIDRTRLHLQPSGGPAIPPDESGPTRRSSAS